MYDKRIQISEQLCTWSCVAEFKSSVQNQMSEDVLLETLCICTCNMAERLQIWLWSENVSRSSPTWWMDWRFLSTALVTQIFRPQPLMLCPSGAHGLSGTPVGSGNTGYIGVSHCGWSSPTWRTILIYGANYTPDSHICQNM